MFRSPRPRLLPVALAALLAVSSTAPGQGVRDKKDEGKGQDPAPALPFQEIPLPKGHAYEVVFSHDGTKMAVGGGAVITVLQVADGKEVVHMQLPREQLLHRLVFAPDDRTLIYNGREDPMVRFFDLKTGRQVREFPQPDPYKERREAFKAEAIRRGKFDKGREDDYGFSSAFRCYSPDGTRMVFANASQGVDVLDIATGKVVAQVQVPDRDRLPDLFSPDGKWLVGHGDDVGVRFYDARTGKLDKVLGKAPGAREHVADYVSFSPDGTFLAAWSQRVNTLDVWDLRTGKWVRTVTAPIHCTTAFLSRDNQSLLAVTAWHEVRLHNLAADKVMHRFRPPEKYVPFAAFTPDEKQVVILGATTGVTESLRYSVFLYDLPPRLLGRPAAPK